MIETPYQLAYELRCDELDVLKNKEHFRKGKIKDIINYRCGFRR